MSDLHESTAVELTAIVKGLRDLSGRKWESIEKQVVVKEISVGQALTAADVIERAAALLRRPARIVTDTPSRDVNHEG